MEKNEKICELCKWKNFIDAKCAVCEGHGKFEPLMPLDDLIHAVSFLVMTPTGNIDIFKAAVLKWGQEIQSNMIIEECAELMIATLDYNYQDKTTEEFTYGDILSSLLSFIKQLLKDARKNNYSLNAQSFDPSIMMEMIRKTFSGEIKKHMNNKREYRNEFIGELADVEIMIGQARHGMGLNHEIDKAKRGKLARLQIRLSS